jgi:hypothetical protein
MTASLPQPAVASAAYTPGDMVQSNLRQQSRLHWKRKEALEMAGAIKQFFDDHDIKVPDTMKKYNLFMKMIPWQLVERYGLLLGLRDDTDANELQAKWLELRELFVFYYRLKETNQAAYALFERGGVLRPMLLMAWYSKHRLDPVWLMRKSQLIRKTYRNYLAGASIEVDESGDLVRLVDACKPFHLTLTVPHPGGVYRGKRFYAPEIVAHFNLLRRRKEWKACVYGGEYGTEVKQGGDGNGLHIHIHSLVYVHRDKVEGFKEWLVGAWKEISGATEIGFDELYVWCEEHTPGAVPVKVREKVNGEWRTKVEKVKCEGKRNKLTPKGWRIEKYTYYINEPVYRYKRFIDHSTDPEEYMKGVMECIKYHFKTDTMRTDDGKLNVPLVLEVLNYSRGMRMYDRFGAFRKVPELNFNRTKPEDEFDLEEQADAADGEGVGVDGAVGEGALMGKAAIAKANLLDPFTALPAGDGDYKLCVAKPEALDYSAIDLPPDSTKRRQRKKPNWGYPYNTDFKEMAPGTTLADIAKALSCGSIQTLFYEAGIHRRPKCASRIMVGYWEPDWYVPDGDYQAFGRRAEWEQDMLAYLN